MYTVIRKPVLQAILALFSLLAMSTLSGAASSVQFLNSGAVLPENMPFSEAVRVDNILYLSGQIGTVPGTLTLVEGGISNESRQLMENIKTVLHAHQLTMNNLVKCTVMMADISEWSTFNSIYREYFVERYPARAAFGANGLALGARVEMECIAVISLK